MGATCRTNINGAPTSFPIWSPPCKGYAKQEKDVLTAVVEARAKATSVKIDASQLTDPDKLKQFQEAQTQLSGALGRLLAVSENYPDLKSNQNFLALQSQLEGTENRIAVARRDYIEAVRAYNTELKTFPSLLWAATLFRGNKPMAEFAAERHRADPAASEVLTAAFVGPRVAARDGGLLARAVPGAAMILVLRRVRASLACPAILPCGAILLAAFAFVNLALRLCFSAR